KMGFCKGSVVNSHMEYRKRITISCEIFSPQDPATEDQATQTHGESSQNQQASPFETSPFSPHLEKTVGWVKILPPSTEDISFHNLREIQNQPQDRKPVPPEAVGSTSRPHGENKQVDKPDLISPATGPVILPFPEEFSLSDSCPGEAEEKNAILQPLMPKKPTKA
ncbi:FETUB protein, partial [Brachypteracias leptosomus]|nr:FETUB protein [Brachypteracias leptosomus]